MISLVAGIFGSIAPPPGVDKYGNFDVGLIGFANNILKLVIVGAGLFAFINFIMAGYTFLGAGGDSKKVAEAWGKIYNSIIGLLFVAGSFVLAAVIGWILFHNAGAILNPVIYGPDP